MPAPGQYIEPEFRRVRELDQEILSAGMDSIAVTGKAGASAWKLSRMTPIDL